VARDGERCETRSKAHATQAGRQEREVHGYEFYAERTSE